MSLVLVDTSVWVRSFRGDPAYTADLERLLEQIQVIGHPFVFGELLMGDLGGRRRFLDDYELMFQARPAPHSLVVQFTRAQKLHGRGIGWMDVHILASAISEQARLWTADARLAAIAEDFGIAYQPRG